MKEIATFNEIDWRALTGSDKKAFSKLGYLTLGYDHLSNIPGVGQKSMDSLLAKGLAVEGERCLHGRTFKLTDKGDLAYDWVKGGRTRVFPST